MTFQYRVRSLASAEQPTSWANRNAVASGDWLARSAAVPPALRRVLGRINTGNVSSPRWLVSARSAATTALQRAALFPSAGDLPAVPDVAPRTGQARRVFTPLAGRDMSATWTCSSPNYPAPVRPALSAAPGLFGGVPVFPSRASGDPAPVRSTGLFPPSTPPAVGPCQHSIGPAGAF